MTQNILWLSLMLLMLAAIIPEKKTIKSKIAGIGWAHDDHKTYIIHSHIRIDEST